MPEPDLPAPPPAPAEPLPAWARPAAAVPGARWLASARRWWQAGTAAIDEPPATGPATAAAPRDEPPPADTGPGLPPGLQERLRRGVAHAVRHPGFGFALLVVQLDLPPGAGGGRGADVGRQAERRLQLALRPGDALAPLPAPASFAAVLDGVANEADLRAIVARVQAELAEPFLDGYQPVKPPSRLGVVFCAPGQPPRPAEALLQLAERALAACEPGGWQLAGPGTRRPDAQRLQRALGQEALELGFVAQVDLAAARIRALGARLAWREAPARRVEPADAGDDDGLAEALLQRSLSLALPAFMAWRSADGARQSCRLALPVSAALVRRAGWADELGTWLQDAGVAGGDLQLELPPTLPLQDRNLPARLQALSRLGVAIALDDFGTGHSSLSVLSRLPLALLKIDGRFVPQAHEVEHHRVLLESTVRLATQLGIATLGKSVESPSQLALLRGLGCQRAEGAAARALLPARALEGLPGA